MYTFHSSVITNDLQPHKRRIYYCLDFIIGTDYDDDIETGPREIIEFVDSKEDVLKDEKTQVLINDFGSSTVNLKSFILGKD
jgi:small-conductance mechanosensitive channel